MSYKYQAIHSEGCVYIERVDYKTCKTDWNKKIYEKEIKIDTSWGWDYESECFQTFETEDQAKKELVKRLESKITEYQQIVKELA